MQLWDLPLQLQQAHACVRSDDAALSPPLLTWLESSTLTSLEHAARAAVHGGLLSYHSSGSLRLKSRLERALGSKGVFAKMLRRMLEEPGQMLDGGGAIAGQWLDRRVNRCHGQRFASFCLVGKYIRHMQIVGRHGPPKLLNAMLRLLTGGVVLSGGENRCLLCSGCLGANSVSHYASSLCWLGPSLRRMFSVRFTVMQRLACTPQKEATLKTAWMCYWLVQGINFARNVGSASRPALSAEYVYRML